MGLIGPRPRCWCGRLGATGMRRRLDSDVATMKHLIDRVAERREMMNEILILNGRLVDPAQGIDGPRELLFRDGRIAAIESCRAGLASLEDSLPKELLIDASGSGRSAGADRHPCASTRAGTDVQGDHRDRARRAAAAGGFTTVVAMPNTVPVNDSVASLEWMLAPEREARVVNLLAMPAATLGSAWASRSPAFGVRGAGARGRSGRVYG